MAGLHKARNGPAERVKVFVDMGESTPIPKGYQKIRVHLVYAVKHDGRHKARLVADGHLTEVPVDSVYSGVVSMTEDDGIPSGIERSGYLSY